MKTFDEVSLPMDLISLLAFNEVIFDKVIYRLYSRIRREILKDNGPLFNHSTYMQVTKRYNLFHSENAIQQLNVEIACCRQRF